MKADFFYAPPCWRNLTRETKAVVLKAKRAAAVEQCRACRAKHDGCPECEPSRNGDGPKVLKLKLEVA